jgi:hypothetical protein
MQTLVYFISHASVLIRYGDEVLITDPWYFHHAFSTWLPNPLPAINPHTIVAMAKAGKASFVMSHVHADHSDPEFIKQIPPETPIFIPEYGDEHFTGFLKWLGHKNHREIPDAGLTHGSFKLNRMKSHITNFDGVVTIETPDAFIFHGNDAWMLSEENHQKLEALKPKNKPSLFMGQGGAASGHPMRYMTIPESERLAALEQKNIRMLKSIAESALRHNFDAALAYACLSRIVVDNVDYSNGAKKPDGNYANEVTGENIFINLSPGDLYIPAEKRVINILSSLNIPQNCFNETVERENFPAVPLKEWQQKYQARMGEYMQALQRYIESHSKTSEDKEELGITFKLIVLDEDETELEAHEINMFGGFTGRTKYCYAKAKYLAQVLDKKTPFEDLYVGYLARWSREPAERYNRRIIDLLAEYGYVHMTS